MKCIQPFTMNLYIVKVVDYSGSGKPFEMDDIFDAWRAYF